LDVKRVEVEYEKEEKRGDTTEYEVREDEEEELLKKRRKGRIKYDELHKKENIRLKYRFRSKQRITWNWEEGKNTYNY
jgi:hypothetical protein